MYYQDKYWYIYFSDSIEHKSRMMNYSRLKPISPVPVLFSMMMLSSTKLDTS